MALRLITGRANCGKTGLVLAAAIESARRGESPTLLTPTLADARRLEDELSDRVPVGIRVSTVRNLASELWTLYGDGRRPVGAAVRQALVAKVIGEGVAAPLRAVSETPGFGRFVLGAVVSSGPKSPDRTEALPRAMSAVASIVERYREELASLGYVEPAWIPSLLPGAKPCLEGSLGLIRFVSLSASHVGLLAALAARNDVSVALTWESGFLPTESNGPSVSRLLELGAEHIIVGSKPPSNELEELAAGLYGQSGCATASGRVILGLASGSEAEVALVARLAREAVDSGYAPERVLIAYQNMERRLDGLHASLEAESLRYESDVKQRVLSTDFGRAFAAVLALAAGSAGRAEAMTLLLGPFSDVDPDVVDKLDRSWRRDRSTQAFRVIGDLVKAGGKVGRLCELASDAAPRQIDAETGRKWQTIADIMLSTAFGMGTPDWSGRRARDVAAHNAVVGAVGEMAGVAGSPFGTRELLQALQTVKTSGSPAETSGFVQLADLAAVGARRFDVIVVGGMNSDEMPGSKPESLEDDLIELLGGEDRAERDADARIQLYSTISSARHRLCLVRQDASDSGAATRASVQWEEVADSYETTTEGGLPSSLCAVGACVSLPRAEISAAAPVFTEGRRTLRHQPESVALRQIEPDRVASDSSCELLGNLGVFSASEIEAYLQCPYRWFYTYVAMPVEIDSEFGAAELGSRAHALLAAFYRDLPDRLGASRVTSANVVEALDLFDQTAQRETARMAQPITLAETLSANQAYLWARQVVADDAALLLGFNPVAVERRFGYEQPHIFAGAPFRGSIDRVDQSDSALVVVDYKSSRAVFGADKFESKRLVQAVLYASAASSELGLPVAGSMYRSLKGRVQRGFWRRDLVGAMPHEWCEDDMIDEAGFERLVYQTEDLVAGAIDGMRAGQIPRKPQTKDACRFCAIFLTCASSQ
jgi:ATP-dependent helicase/nuclease subunit B